MHHDRPIAAFTLIELLVVTTIIAVLLSLLAPAMDKAIESAMRAKCAAGLYQIHRKVWDYAFQNRQKPFIARYRAVQHAISNDTNTSHPQFTQPGDEQVDWILAAASVGLVIEDQRPGASYDVNGKSYHPSKLWDCPSSTFKSQFVDASNNRSMVLGYQYLGGILMWGSPFGQPYLNRESLSPENLTTSKPNWVLLADRVHYRAASNPSWSQNHQATVGSSPPLTGGNQAYVDGSVEWVPFLDMKLVHSWHNNNSEFHLFKQTDLGSIGLPPAADADAVLNAYP